MFATIPEGRVPWFGPRMRGAWLAAGIALVLALVFFPKNMINADEVHYAGQARILLHGRLVPVDGDPFPTPLANVHQFVRYPLGWPLLLAPASLIGFRFMYLLPLLVHLTGGLLAGRLFVRRELPSWLSAVFLFHPLFWSFSRTLMSDLPAAVFMLAAMDAWEERRGARGALALAYSLLIRFAAFTSIVGFGLAVLPNAWKRRKDIALIALAGAVAVGVALVTNKLTHGSSTRYAQSSGSQAFFDGKNVGQHLLLYGAGLLVIPPFPLLSIALGWRRCERWVLAAVPTLAFFVIYSYHDESPRWLETLFGGQRLILAAHAVLFVATASVWARVPLVLRWPKLVMAAGVSLAVLSCFMTRRLEQRYGRAVEALASCAPSRVAFNGNASRAALAMDAPEFHMVDDREAASLGDVVLIAKRPPSNRWTTADVSYAVPESLRAGMRSCRAVGEFELFDMTGRCPPPDVPCALEPPKDAAAKEAAAK